LIADHTFAHTLETYGVLLGVLLLGVGYAVGQWRRGRNDATSSILEIANAEIEVLKAARERMSEELRDYAAKIAKLEAVAEQQQRENRSLRELVMLEAVPPALQAALSAEAGNAVDAAAKLHEATRERILAELADAERRVSALLQQMTTTTTGPSTTTAGRGGET
jgi:predicted outer membrane protein